MSAIQAEQFRRWRKYLKGLKANGYYDPEGKYPTYVDFALRALRDTGKADLNKVLDWEREARHGASGYEFLLEKVLDELFAVYCATGVIDTDDPGC